MILKWFDVNVTLSCWTHLFTFETKGQITNQRSNSSNSCCQIFQRQSSVVQTSSLKNWVLKIFSKRTWKNLCWIQRKCFPVNFAEFLWIAIIRTPGNSCFWSLRYCRHMICLGLQRWCKLGLKRWCKIDLKEFRFQFVVWRLSLLFAKNNMEMTY